MNTHDKIELPPLPEPEFPGVIIKGTKAIPRYLFTANQLDAYAIAAIEPYRKALNDLIRDLEIRSNLKRGDDKGVVDCGNGVYRQALMVLGELK